MLGKLSLIALIMNKHSRDK